MKIIILPAFLFMIVGCNNTVPTKTSNSETNALNHVQQSNITIQKEEKYHPIYQYTYTDEKHIKNQAAVKYINNLSASDLSALCTESVTEALSVAKDDNSTIFVYMERVVHLSNEKEYDLHVKTIKRYATDKQHPDVTLTKEAIKVFTNECTSKPLKTVRQVANITFTETVKKSYKVFFQNIKPTMLSRNCDDIFTQYVYLPRSSGKHYVWVAIMDEAMKKTSPARYNEYKNLMASIKSKKVADNIYFMTASDNFNKTCKLKSSTVRDAAKSALKEALDPFYRQ